MRRPRHPVDDPVGALQQLPQIIAPVVRDAAATVGERFELAGAREEAPDQFGGGGGGVLGDAGMDRIEPLQRLHGPVNHPHRWMPKRRSTSSWGIVRPASASVSPRSMAACRSRR